MNRFALAVLPLFFHVITSAQTFSAGGAPIPDDGTTLSLPINVSGLPNQMNASFGIETVCFDIVHTWISDLNVYVISPGGVTIDLTSGNGGDTDFYTNTCFNQTSDQSVIEAGSPYTGTFRPESTLAQFNTGEDPNGIWQIYIVDTYPFADVGDLISCSITFGTAPALPYPYDGGLLPILLFNTAGQSIQDEPKVLSSLGIIDNGPGVFNSINDAPNGFDGHVGIELRGNSSQGFPKKSYSIEIWDQTQNDSAVVLLGFPEESDFVLHSAYSDKTLMRNALTYGLYGAMGHYSPRCRFVELVLNGEYQGVYVLMEKIKRDSARINIAKLNPEDIAGDELTGGYIIKIDWAQGNFTGGWRSSIGSCLEGSTDTIFYQYEYPDGNVIAPEQSNYIRSYVNAFENALLSESLYDTVNGYRKYVDTRSFADAMIVNELAKNVDGYWLSTFFYKDKDSKGGKLTYGPLWDFDLAWRNAYYSNGADPSGWRYKQCDDGAVMPVWFNVMDGDSVFRNEVKCRYMELRQGILSTTSLFARIDSMSSVIGTATTARNFDYWPILGTYVWPNPDPIPATYSGEINALKNWIALRLGWMDAFLPGTCTTTGLAQIETTTLKLYPNPTNDVLQIQADAPLQMIRVLDLTGREVLVEMAINAHVQQISMQHLPAGVYVLQVAYRDGGVITRGIVRN